MYSFIITKFGLVNQNWNVTDFDFQLLIAGKPSVKLFSLQVTFLPAPPVYYMYGNQIG